MITNGIYFKNFKYKKNAYKIVSILKEILKKKDSTLQSLSKNFKESYNKKILRKFSTSKNFRIIGMGGSILGAEAIYSFLKDKIKKNFVFINDLDESIKSKKNQKYSNLVVSKSGETIETIVNFNLLSKKTDKNLFITENKDWFSQIGMSFFEMTVALAFDHFAKEKVDMAIIEVGLGGRLDSTNIIQPELSIITNIGLDHTNLLGDSIEKITKEKGGIIKPNTTVIIGRKQNKTKAIFDQIAHNNKSNLHYAENCDYESDLKGNYQKENINTAYTAIKILRSKGWSIKDYHIKNGFKNVQKNTSLLGRWMIMGDKPKIICDTAHNVDGIESVFKQIFNLKFQNLHIVFGVVEDKKIDNILKLLPKNAQYYLCQAKIPRAMDVNQLHKKVHEHQLSSNYFKSVASALKHAKLSAKENDLIFIGGSTFVVAEII